MPPIKSQDKNRRHFQLFYLTPLCVFKNFHATKKARYFQYNPKTRFGQILPLSNHFTFRKIKNQRFRACRLRRRVFQPSLTAHRPRRSAPAVDQRASIPSRIAIRFIHHLLSLCWLTFLMLTIRFLHAIISYIKYPGGVYVQNFNLRGKKQPF